mgnify:CR=1 FL=1
MRINALNAATNANATDNIAIDTATGTKKITTSALAKSEAMQTEMTAKANSAVASKVPVTFNIGNAVVTTNSNGAKISIFSQDNREFVIEINEKQNKFNILYQAADGTWKFPAWGNEA